MKYDFTSRFNTEWEFMEELYDSGYKETDDWINENFRRLGSGSTIDLDELGVTVDWSWIDDECTTGTIKRD